MSYRAGIISTINLRGGTKKKSLARLMDNAHFCREGSGVVVSLRNNIVVASGIGSIQGTSS